jgi:hypothetical protein
MPHTQNYSSHEDSKQIVCAHHERYAIGRRYLARAIHRLGEQMLSISYVRNTLHGEKEMRRNLIGYLGFLGFLGLLGLISDNPGFFGLFGFFGFWSSMWGRGSDERVDQNVNRACRNAFVFTMAASALLFSYLAILHTAEAFQLTVSVAVLFAGSLTIFVASFVYYDRFSARESSG